MRALLAMLLLVPLVAGGAAGLEPADRRDGPGAQWVAYDVSTDGAPFRIAIFAHGAPQPIITALALSAADGTPLGRAFSGGFNVNPMPSYWADLPAASVSDWSSPGDGLWGIDVTFNGPAVETPVVGAYRVVVWVAGAPRSWEALADVSPGAEVLRVEQGERTFLRTARDFSGVVAGGANFFGVGARANVGGTVTQTMENGLVGFFTPIFASYDVLEMESERGAAACPCAFDAAAPAGTYVFRATGVGAPFTGASDLILTGADAP